jgi:hypothetical protein
MPVIFAEKQGKLVLMTLSLKQIGLKPAQIRAVARKARHEGKTPPEYLRSLIERDLMAAMPFDEILKPVRDDFRRSGITPGQLDRIVERARNARRLRAS